MHQPKYYYSLLFFSFLLMFAMAASAQLRVSANKRFLITADGKLFFYLGDTAWELFHKLNRNDAYTYLSDRASKGFNVIQCVVLAEMNGLTEANTNGDLPFQNLDPNRPNEAYFQHVDALVKMGASMGLYMAMLPTWGAWVGKENHPLFPSIQLFNAESAKAYGLFLGRRYRNTPNIIWVLGGDRNPTGFEQVWEAMAQGLQEGDGRSHLITYHPTGQMSSSKFWQNAPWLDFNMVQTGHAARFINSYDFIAHDYNLKPIKPTFDSETNYEDAGVSFHTSNGIFSDYDVRVSSYFSVFAGGFGITYGCNSIWQMYSGGPSVLNTKRTWKESLNLPGSFQMRYLKHLMESRPFLTRIPDQQVLLLSGSSLVETETKSNQHVQATRDGTVGNKDATYIMLYLPVGKGVRVNTSFINSKRLKVWWYDPRQGTALPVGETENKGEYEPSWNTLPWHTSAGPDWVLVIDDATKNYLPPGQKKP
jgi:hypothetical protein